MFGLVASSPFVSRLACKAIAAVGLYTIITYFGFLRNNCDELLCILLGLIEHAQLGIHC